MDATNPWRTVIISAATAGLTALVMWGAGALAARVDDVGCSRIAKHLSADDAFCDVLLSNMARREGFRGPAGEQGLRGAEGPGGKVCLGKYETLIKDVATGKDQIRVLPGDGLVVISIAGRGAGSTRADVEITGADGFLRSDFVGSDFRVVPARRGDNLRLKRVQGEAPILAMFLPVGGEALP